MEGYEYSLVRYIMTHYYHKFYAVLLHNHHLIYDGTESLHQRVNLTLCHIMRNPKLFYLMLKRMARSDNLHTRQFARNVCCLFVEEQDSDFWNAA